MPKKRLDILMDERGLADSRTRAQALIMAGKVRVNGEVVTKAGQAIPEEAEISVDGKDHPWVSRGGIKLAHGLEHFGINPTGMVCVDVGASTGGFTDVLLHHGAAKVYAVDVGHGQLDWKLRNDQRVVVMEQTNARHLTAGQIPDAIDLIVCDASFISLKTVLPAVMGLASGEQGQTKLLSPPLRGGDQGEGGNDNLSPPPNLPPQGGGIKKSEYVSMSEMGSDIQHSPLTTHHSPLLIALIKPQFEAGREKVGKGGVVRDENVHKEVCEMIHAWLENEMGWKVAGITESPITGPSGNKEFLVCATSAS